MHLAVGREIISLHKRTYSNVDLRELKETNSNSGRHPWETARLSVVADLMEAYLPELKNNPDFILLDVGCGDTFFIENMAKKYSQAKMFGIDTAFDTVLLNQLNNKFEGSSIRVFDSVENATPFIDKSVSVVLLLDVIEHIEDDIAFLKWLKSQPFITENTQFIISVPAYQKLFCSHDVFLGHYRRYTNKMLTEHIHQSGLQTTNHGYFFFSLLLPRVVQVVKEKLFGTPDLKKVKGLAVWQPSKVKEAILHFILKTDFKIGFLFKKIGLNFPGLSNYAICKKPVS